MRTAIVHHWLVTHGGGERVAEVMADMFPDAEIFTLFQRPAGTLEGLRQPSNGSTSADTILFSPATQAP
jgi:hypothetical protein